MLAGRATLKVGYIKIAAGVEINLFFYGCQQDQALKKFTSTPENLVVLGEWPHVGITKIPFAPLFLSLHPLLFCHTFQILLRTLYLELLYFCKNKEET